MVLARLVADAAGAVRRLEDRPRRRRHDAWSGAGFRACVLELASDVDARLAGAERRRSSWCCTRADAVDTVLDRAGTDALRKVLRFGPETGVHVLGWWRSVQRLRSLLTLTAVGGRPRVLGGARRAGRAS